MSYTPGRSGRYAHLSDLLADIEARQCRGCAHRAPDPDMPMCPDRAATAAIQEPIDDWHETTDGTVTCAAATHEPNRPPRRPETPTMTTAAANLAEVRAMAYWLAAHGCPVFPLRVGGKTPATGRGFKDATCDPDQVAHWWAQTPYNVGLATGPAGLCVIDLDTPKPGTTLPAPWDTQPGIAGGLDVLAALAEAAGQPLPLDTRTVTTPSGGLHLYFTTDRPMPSTAGRLGPMIDTRAAGGYVVTPPSLSEVGAYETVNPAPIAPLPAWIADALAPTPPTAPRSAPVREAGPLRGVDGYAFAAFEAEVDNVLAALPGTRNDTLNRAAYALGQFVAAGRLPEHDVTDALTIAAEHIGLAPRETQRTIASGLAAARTRPRIGGAA